MKINNLFAQKNSKPKARKWSVTFLQDDGKTIACTGIYTSKKEAVEAMKKEGGTNLKPIN